MPRAARILVVLSAFALAVALAWSQAPTPRMAISGDPQVLPAKAPPSTTVDITMVGPDGRDATFRARTDPFGNLPIGGYVPWNEWTAANAARSGGIALPGDANGFYQYGSLEDGTLVRRPIATSNGSLDDPQSRAQQIASAFSLYCRADEGPPQALAVGDRYTFDVPRASLQSVLAQPVFTDVTYFALPDGRGYGVSVAPRTDPQATWSTLQGLAQQGTITSLERDACMNFLPEGEAIACPPPKKPVRIAGDVSSTLRDARQLVLVDGASVLVQPLSPTPFANPGPRPGDERPPVLVRTGSDGRYQVPVGATSGVIEIGVAKGCEQRTTLAIAEGTPQTVVRGSPTPPTQTRSPPPHVNAPPTSAELPKPQPNERVCGPDITDHVLGTLQLMIQTHSQMSPDEVKARCDSLYSSQADGAWEMRFMGPFESDRSNDQYIYFGRFGFQDRCAVPKNPCGATVEFLGYCLDVQIVNYVEWGAINALCGTVGMGVQTHWLRDRVVTTFRGALNGELVFGEGDAYQTQELMARLGGHWVGTSTPLPWRKERLESIMRHNVQSNSSVFRQTARNCPLNCDKYVAEKPILDSFEWGFKWGDQYFDRRGSALEKP